MSAISENSPDATLVLPGKLGTDTAPQLWNQAIALGPGPVTIKASGVEQIGALSLQVLLALVRECREKGRTVTLESPSPRFLNDLAEMGVSKTDLINEVTE